MRGPVPSAPAPDATLELEGQDVIQVIPAPPAAPSPQRQAPPAVPIVPPSARSIAPVGVDLSAGRGPLSEDELANTTLGIRLPERRRRLRGVVIATVSACVLILIAAGIAHVGDASSQRSFASSPATPPITAAPAVAPPPAPAPMPSPVVGSQATLNAPTTGTLRLERNLVPRWVLLDGKKLNTRSDVVSCGPHQLKVGRAKTRAVDIPCGGELKIAR